MLDTNVLVSALLFRGGRLTWLRHAWMARDFQPLVSHSTAGELLRVLSYPKFHLTPEDIVAVAADFLPFAEAVEVSDENPARWPGLADADDCIFLALAEAGRAHFVVTGDTGPLGAYRVVSPEEFRHILAPEAQ